MTPQCLCPGNTPSHHKSQVSRDGVDVSLFPFPHHHIPARRPTLEWTGICAHLPSPGSGKIGEPRRLFNWPPIPSPTNAAVDGVGSQTPSAFPKRTVRLQTLRSLSFGWAGMLQDTVTTPSVVWVLGLTCWVAAGTLRDTVTTPSVVWVLGLTCRPPLACGTVPSARLFPPCRFCPTAIRMTADLLFFLQPRPQYRTHGCSGGVFHPRSHQEGADRWVRKPTIASRTPSSRPTRPRTS